MRKLNDVMPLGRGSLDLFWCRMRRPDTFEDDINTVRQRLSKERPDIGVLITQLDRGIFVTKANIHPVTCQRARIASKEGGTSRSVTWSRFFKGSVPRRNPQDILRATCVWLRPRI